MAEGSSGTDAAHTTVTAEKNGEDESETIGKDGTDFWPFSSIGTDSAHSTVTDEMQKNSEDENETIDAVTAAPIISKGFNFPWPFKKEKAVTIPLPNATYEFKNTASGPPSLLMFKLERYPMRAIPHGRVIVICNSEFKKKGKLVPSESLPGALVDGVNVGKTFSDLRYNVEVYENLTSHQILHLVSEVSHADHGAFDSFVCFITTHGTEKKEIVGSDYKPVKLEKIYECFTAKSSPQLAGKPKMFFIQACGGLKIDRGAVVSDGDGVVEDGEDEVIPIESDFFISYATPDGYVAWSSDTGSRYVTEVCKVLSRNASHDELHHMMLVVNAKLAKQNCSDHGYKQAPEFRSRLRKGVYFLTGEQ